jgi:hypothetical protein
MHPREAALAGAALGKQDSKRQNHHAAGTGTRAGRVFSLESPPPSIPCRSEAGGKRPVCKKRRLLRLLRRCQKYAAGGEGALRRHPLRIPANLEPCQDCIRTTLRALLSSWQCN